MIAPTLRACSRACCPEARIVTKDETLNGETVRVLWVEITDDFGGLVRVTLADFMELGNKVHEAVHRKAGHDKP